MATAAELGTIYGDVIASLRETRGMSATMQRILRSSLVAVAEAAGLPEVIRANVWAGFRVVDPQAFDLKPARGLVRVATTQAGVTFQAGELVLQHPVTSKRYRALGPATGIYDVKPGPFRVDLTHAPVVAIEAEELGAASTAADGTSFVIVPDQPGMTAIASGHVIGTDTSSELDIRTLALAGDDAPTAIAARAVRRASAQTIANRAREMNGVLVCASVSGPLGGSDVARLAAALGRQTTPVTTPATAPRKGDLVSAIGRPVAVSCALSVYDLLDAPTDAELEAMLEARLTDFFASQPIGPRTLSAAAIDTAVRAALGLSEKSTGVFGYDHGSTDWLASVSVSSPTSDIVLAAYEVPVFSGVSVTIERSELI